VATCSCVDLELALVLLEAISQSATDRDSEETCDCLRGQVESALLSLCRSGSGQSDVGVCHLREVIGASQENSCFSRIGSDLRTPGTLPDFRLNGREGIVSKVTVSLCNSWSSGIVRKNLPPGKRHFHARFRPRMASSARGARDRFNRAQKACGDPSCGAAGRDERSGFGHCLTTSKTEPDKDGFKPAPKLISRGA
jgi:hypothetical protein